MWGHAMALGRGVLLLAVLGASWVAGSAMRVGDIYLTSAYHFAILSLLAIGLYGSTRTIDFPELWKNRRTVMLALSLGVMAKVVFIASVMLLLYPEPASLVLGVAVAQIDPLAVAAAGRRRRMSESAKAVLNAWAAFDDPVTVLLTVYLSMFALRLGGGGPAAGGSAAETEFAVGLLLNVLYAAAAFAVWWFARRTGLAEWLVSGGFLARAGQVAVGVLALGYAALGVTQALMLGIALVGLFFRPYLAWQRTADGIVFGALLVATAALGLVLAGTAEGITPGLLLKGAVLGVAAYVAQVLTGGLLSRGRGRFDRLYLAFSQQNGLTAIVLALVLEPDFPGAVAVIALAIVVTNVLYGAGSALVNRLEQRADRQPVPKPVVAAPTVAPPVAPWPVTAATVRQAPFAEPARPKPGTAR
jgi:NhaP-type Na+/H+ or K+/H+ antiporter